MKRRLFTLALCVMVLAYAVMPVCAAQMGFLRDVYDIADWDMLLYGTSLPEGGTLTVSTDSQTLEAAAATVGQAEAPVSIYCLVDASTSLNEQQQKQQREILENIASRMGANDNMVIATFDEKVVESSLTGDGDVIKTAAKTIGRRVWQKNLYQAVVQALETLQTSSQLHSNRILLILSDGNDSGRTDVTEKKAIAAIEKTRFPVYSIALTGNSMGQKMSSYAAHLKNLSEASLGGICLMPAKEKISAANAADKVWQDIQSGTLIWVNLADVQNFGRDFTLRVRYETASQRLEDTLTVYAADLPERGITPAVPTETLAPETQLPEETKTGIPVWVWVAGGLVLAAVIALVVVLIVKKNKKAPKEEPKEQVIDEPVFEQIITDSEATASVDPVSFDWNSAGTTQPVAPPAGGCKLDFVALMHPDVHFSFQLAPHKPVTFGRDSRADLILNGSDVKLSGIHFEAEWDEKHLYIRDKNSTNGTRVNGGLCKPESWIPVEDGSTLNVGGYDYRVSVSAIRP